MAIKAKDRARLAAFMDACLDPLPPAVLVDMAFNLAIRNTRRSAWRIGRIGVNLARATFEYHAARRSYAMFVQRDDLQANLIGKQETASLLAYREAAALQVLLPAPDQDAVKWKRLAIKDQYLPVERERLDRAIAEDEAFLAAHPTKRDRRVGAT